MTPLLRGEYLGFVFIMNFFSGMRKNCYVNLNRINNFVIVSCRTRFMYVVFYCFSIFGDMNTVFSIPPKFLRTYPTKFSHFFSLTPPKALSHYSRFILSISLLVKFNLGFHFGSLEILIPLLSELL